jgi:hypothetical protein
MRAFPGLGVIVALVVGCGGDGGGGATTSGLAGVYRVESRTRRQPCDSAGEPEAMPYPFTYFAVMDDPLLNGLFVNALPCTSAQLSSCDDTQHILFLGKAVADGEFAGGTYQRSESGGSCAHSWNGARVKKTATGVTLQEEYRSEERASSTCQGDLSEAEADKGASLGCVSLEASVGVRM